MEQGPRKCEGRSWYIRAASCPGSLNELTGEGKGRLRSVNWACPGRPKGPRFCSQEPDRPWPDSKAARAWNLWLQNPPLPYHHSTPQTCPSWPRPHWEGSWLVEGCGQAHSKASWQQLGSPDPPHHPSAFHVGGRAAGPSSLEGGGLGTRPARRGLVAPPRGQAAPAQGRPGSDRRPVWWHEILTLPRRGGAMIPRPQGSET